MLQNLMIQHNMEQYLFHFAIFVWYDNDELIEVILRLWINVGVTISLTSCALEFDLIRVLTSSAMCFDGVTMDNILLILLLLLSLVCWRWIDLGISDWWLQSFSILLFAWSLYGFECSLFDTLWSLLYLFFYWNRWSIFKLRTFRIYEDYF